MRLTLMFSLAGLTLLPACFRNSADHGGNPPGSGNEAADDVVWVEQGVEHEGMQINLGYRQQPADGDLLEPIAKISRDSKPIANAMVFNSLVSEVGGQVIGEEAATVFEQVPDSESDYYAGKLHPPEGTSERVVRYRIVFPDSPQAWTRDVPMRP